MATLEGLFGGLAEQERVTVTIDATDVFGEDGVFVFGEPSLAAIFKAGEWALNLKRRYPDWTEQMCQSVAYVAQAHVSPEPSIGQNVGLLYAELADKQPRLFQRFWSAVLGAFSTASELEEAAEKREGE
jgi:hypothetical protein